MKHSQTEKKLARIVARIRHDPRHAEGFEPSLAIRMEYVREILEVVRGNRTPGMDGGTRPAIQLDNKSLAAGERV